MRPIKAPQKTTPAKPTTQVQSLDNFLTRDNNFLGLSVIFRDNKDTLPKMLESIKGTFDQLVFVDTGSVDGARQLVADWAMENKENLSIVDFVWVDDFAKARNVGWKELKTRWKMFIDSDDELVGAGNIRRLLKQLEAQSPVCNAVFVPYDYDVLEELETCRIAKGDAWHFADAIHERLVLNGSDKNIQFGKFAKTDVHTKHKRKSKEEREAALRRNFIIAEREYAVTEDKDYKARLARTIAMLMKLEGRVDDAIPYLEELAISYEHLPEGKQACADLSRSFSVKGDFDKAKYWAKKAGPAYEAIVAHTLEDHETVLLKQPMALFSPITATHEGMLPERVFAQVALADSCLKVGEPPEVVENVLNHVRTDLRMFGPCANIVNQIRDHIDRITILIPGTPQPWTDTTDNGMLGGSEAAALFLSRELAKQGRNVRIYMEPMSQLRLPGVGPSGVDYQPLKNFDINNENGTIVVWRSVHMLDQLLGYWTQVNHRAKQGDEKAHIPSGNYQISLWLHDQAMGAPPQVAQALLEATESVIVLSDHHKRQISRELIDPSKVNFVKLANGVEGKRLEQARLNTAKDPFKVVYSSCPTRGLMVLLDMWPKVKEAIPEAHLEIFYDWSGVKNYQPAYYQQLLTKLRSVEHLNVTHHGGVPHERLHEEVASARVWAYSHFDNPGVETFCISIVQANALGTQVLTVPNGALPEVASGGVFTNDKDDYCNKLIDILRGEGSGKAELEGIALQAISRFDWEAVAAEFSKVWTRKYRHDKKVI